MGKGDDGLTALWPKIYSPPEVDRIWLWVYHNKIPIYPIFFLLKGTIGSIGVTKEVVAKLGAMRGSRVSGVLGVGAHDPQPGSSLDSGLVLGVGRVPCKFEGEQVLWKELQTLWAYAQTNDLTCSLSLCC